MTIRDIFIRFGYDVDKASEQKAEQSIQKLKTTATKLLGAIGIGFSLVQLNALAEEFNGINDQIRYATQGLGEQEEIQQKILTAANNARVAYGNTADVVSKLVQTSSDIFDLDEAVEFAELTTKFFKTAGQSESDITALQNALNQSFAKGSVQASTLNTLFQKSPASVNLLTKSLGVSKEALIDMANQGQISLEDLKNAFMGSADAINEAFDELDLSVSDALLNIRNKWGLFIDGLNSSLGVTQTVAKVMVRGFNSVLEVLKKLQTFIERVSKAVGGFERLLKLLAIAAGAIFIAMNSAKILTFLQNATKMLGNLNLKMLAIAAVIIIIALLIEDFINFMQGNDSLIGSLFDQMGINSEEVRAQVMEIWGQVKDFLSSVWGTLMELAKAVGGALLDILKQLLPVLGQIIKQVLPVILELLGSLIPLVQEIIETLLPILLQLFETLLPVIGQVVEAILPVLLSLVESILPVISQIAKNVLPAIVQVIQTLLPVIKKVVDAVLPVLLSLVQAILPLIQKIADAVLPVILKLVEALIPLFDAAISLLGPILDLVIALITPLLGVIDALMPFIDLLMTLLFSLLEPLIPIIEVLANILGAILGPAFEIIAAVIGVVVDAISTFIGWIQSAIEWAGKAASAIGNFFSGLFGGGKVEASVEQTTAGAVATGGTVTNTAMDQEVNITNNFNGGDRAAQEQGAAAMTQSANDATAEMARGMAYAR